MSSSETGSRLSRRGLLGLALGAAATSGGCLRPLYAEHTSSRLGGSVRAALHDVEVKEIKGLLGHHLRNELVFELDGGGESGAAKRLELAATVSESLDVITVDVDNGRADSAVLVATANWTVTRLGSSEVVASGRNVVRAPYDRSSQRFATVRAARDAQIRAARSLAGLIKAQLAADLVA